MYQSQRVAYEPSSPVALYVFWREREDWGLGWGARGVSWEGKKEKNFLYLFPWDPARAQPNPQSSLIPKKHLNSDWVRVWDG